MSLPLLRKAVFALRKQPAPEPACACARPSGHGPSIVLAVAILTGLVALQSERVWAGATNTYMQELAG